MQDKLISTSQTNNGVKRPLILGGSGRVGRMLAALWSRALPAPLWQHRTAQVGADVIWDILHQDPPEIAPPVSAVIILAGVTCGTDVQLAQNTQLAQAGSALARHLRVKALVASSQAVYGRQTGVLSEATPAAPATPYGQAKLDMENVVSDAHVTCLRLGNVAGCDGLFQAMERGPIAIDQFSDGQGPRRMMIGPRDLATVLATLCATQAALPRVLNVASPDLVSMNAMAQVADVAWKWQPAPTKALPVLTMNVDLLNTYVPVAKTTAPDLIAQARAGGWRPAL